MVKHEIDKETLRHDAFRETMFEATGYVLKHKSLFIALGVGLFLLAAGIFGGSIFMDYQREQLSIAYYQAEKLLQDTGSGQKESLAAAVKGLQKFIDEHPGSDFTPAAWMHIARISWEEKDLDRAEQAFKAVLAHGETTELTRSLASIGLAKVMENRGDYAASGSLYGEVDEKAFGSVKAFHQGRIAMAQKNVEEARQKFQTVKENAPPSVLKTWAEDVLSFLPTK